MVGFGCLMISHEIVHSKSKVGQTCGRSGGVFLAEEWSLHDPYAGFVRWSLFMTSVRGRSSCVSHGARRGAMMPGF